MLGVNLEEVGYACLGFILSKSIGNRKKPQNQTICIRTIIKSIASISKLSVAFNLKNSVLCRQYTNNTSSLQLKGHTAQGDVDKRVLGTIVSKPLLAYKRSSKALKKHSNAQFFIYSYGKNPTF